MIRITNYGIEARDEPMFDRSGRLAGYRCIDEAEPFNLRLDFRVDAAGVREVVHLLRSLLPDGHALLKVLDESGRHHAAGKAAATAGEGT